MDKKVLRWNYIFQYGYVFTNIFNSLLLLPLYVRFIDAETLGVWLATGNILAWLTMADPGIGDVLQQKIAELNGAKSYKELSLTIGSGIMASIIVLLLATVIGLGFYFSLDILLNSNIRHYQNLPEAFLISVISSAVTLVSFSFSGINQGLHLPKQVAISYILSNVLFLLVNVWLLYMNYSLLSIAFANLSRALFLVVYNFIFVMRFNKTNQISFERRHFKKFIRIFSYTSFSKMLLAFANNIDLLILARYIPAKAITLFEINRRPLKMAQGLIGRYSVALMPSISYSKGQEDMEATKSFVNKRLRIYAHITIIIAFLVCLTYQDIIMLWVGNGNYAGHLVTVLLASTFCVYCIGYFMLNIGYALGDFKVNSFFAILKCSLIIIFTLIGAYFWGINGVLFFTLTITFLVDMVFYTRRLVKMGFLSSAFFKNVLGVWSKLIPVSLVVLYINYRYTLPGNDRLHALMHCLLVSMAYLLLSFAIICLSDKEIQNDLSRFKIKLFKKVNFSSSRSVNK